MALFDTEYLKKTARDTAIVAIEENRKQNPDFQMVPFSMTFSNPYPRFQGNDIIYVYLLKNGTR